MSVILIAGKRGPTRLGFPLRFPEGRSELPDEAVEWLARQVKVPPSDLGFYDCPAARRSTTGHRAQIRRHFGFRECSVADQEKLTEWLAAHVANAEWDRDRVRAELFRRCRSERTEPPTPTGLPGSSGRHCTKRSRSGSPSSPRGSPLPAPRDPLSPWSAPTTASSPTLTAPDDEDEEDDSVVGDDEEDQDSVLALVKSVPGNVDQRPGLPADRADHAEDVLAGEAWAGMLGPADRRGLTPLFWQHVRPNGEVRLDMGARLRIGGAG